MKKSTSLQPGATLLAGLVALGVLATAPCYAEEPGIAARPLTPNEIHDYHLPEGTQTSGGLFTVGVGAPVYLEVQVPQGTEVTDVAWSLTGMPDGSATVLAESPLGAEIPIYNPGDRDVNSVASRRLLVPDMVGVYAVSAVVTTDGDPLSYSREITAATYTGVYNLKGIPADKPYWCALCHSPEANSWAGTGHATMFTEAIDGLKSDHYNSECISCHTVGYDESPLAVNGGFDDVAAEVGWTFPETLEPGNWAAMPAALQDVSNIQCENCHGPGGLHAGAKGRISVSTSSGDCAQCHDEKPYHNKNLEWNQSRHAVITRSPTGESRSGCVRCHSGVGFIDYADGKPQDELRTEWEAIVCVTCHDPHSPNNPHQIRKADPVTLMNGHVVEQGGNGRLCMNCHMSRRDAEDYVQEYHSHFGPHYGPQGDMIAGSNAIEYGRVIPKSTHIVAVGDSCVGCHLQAAVTDETTQAVAGGHTFKMVLDPNTPDDPSDDVDLTQTCSNCHGEIESFDLVRQDYDGNGQAEGVQTEINNLMHRLGMLLPPLGSPEVEVTEDYTSAELKAGFNYLFVEEDGSHGVHNASYAAGILKASIADLTGNPAVCGDSDDDGLADDWEIEHFGSIEAQDGMGDPDLDMVNNAMEHKVRTLPNVADSDNDGFTDFEELHVGTDPLNAEDNPELGRNMMYLAAEMVFFTEEGKRYQVQGVAELGSAQWENVGDEFDGTGGMRDLLISTRDTQMNYYRVVEVEAP